MSLTDDELRTLYAVGPDDFVRVRNELARSLRKDGRRDDANALAALRRPSAVAWALNRIAHDRAPLLDTWFDAATRLRNAMHGALRGDADDVRAAQSAERQAVDAVVAAARQQLDEIGQRNADAVGQRIAGTMRAASLDDDVARRLRSGTLESDVVASGFGFAEMSIDETRERTAVRHKTSAPARVGRAEKPPTTRSGGISAKERAAEERAKERAVAAERRSRQAEVARLTTIAARLESTADKAQRKVDELRAHAEQLQERLRVAEREARQARSESDRAAAAAARARIRRDN